MSHGTVYSYNDTIYATQHYILGWSICFDLTGEWQSLVYGDVFTIKQLMVLRSAFSGQLHPPELKQAIRNAILRTENIERRKRVDAYHERLRLDTVMAEAEAKAIAPVETELVELKRQLQEAKTNEQYMLSRLAIAHLSRLEQCFTRQDMLARIRRIRGLLLDGCFELSLRQLGSNGAFLHYNDCQVLVKRPDDPELIELLQDLIPFTQ